MSATLSMPQASPSQSVTTLLDMSTTLPMPQVSPSQSVAPLLIIPATYANHYTSRRGAHPSSQTRRKLGPLDIHPSGRLIHEVAEERIRQIEGYYSEEGSGKRRQKKYPDVRELFCPFRRIFTFYNSPPAIYVATRPKKYVNTTLFATWRPIYSVRSEMAFIF